jgi:hypothetical protein
MIVNDFGNLHITNMPLFTGKSEFVTLTFSFRNTFISR